MADAIRDLQRRAENAEREVRHLAAEHQALRTRAELAERRLAGFGPPPAARPEPAWPSTMEARHG